MQRSLAPLLGLALATLALAGCSDSPASPDDAGAPSASGGLHGSHEAGVHLLAPNHTLGDWWAWSSPQIEGTYTSVLAADEGNDWLMATDHPDIAWFDARSDIASLGQVRKSDMAGSQGSTRVEFFRFPMTPGLNWTTTWDEQPMSMKVLDVKGGVANLEARRADDTLYAAYTYLDSHGYFGQIAYYDANGTEVGFESEVTGFGKSFAGDLLRWDYETRFQDSGAIAGAAFAQNLPVPLTATDVYVDLFVQCDSGAFAAGVAPMPVVTTFAGVDERGAGTNDGACPLTTFFSGSAGEPRQTVPGSTEEQWGFSGFGAPAAAGTYTFNIYVRTLQKYPVGSA